MCRAAFDSRSHNLQTVCVRQLPMANVQAIVGDLPTLIAYKPLWRAPDRANQSLAQLDR